MRLENCWFCSSTVYPGHGITFVRNDAKIFRFCRSKYHKNFKMKRNPRKVKWTKAYRKLHGKELAKDSTFELERRRNRPERYDRNVVENTIKAMKKIEEVRVKRESKFWEGRMKGKKALDRKQAAAELEQSIHMVKAPLAMQADPSLTLPREPEQIKVKVAGKQQRQQSTQPMALDRKQAAAELGQSIQMVKAPLAMQADPSLTLPREPEQIKVKVAGKQQRQQSTQPMQE